MGVCVWRSWYVCASVFVGCTPRGLLYRGGIKYICSGLRGGSVCLGCMAANM